MSDQQPTVSPVELSTGLRGQSDVFRVEFADGIAEVPSFVVQAIGGPAEIERLAPALKNVLFGDFMNGYRTMCADNYARGLFQKHIDSHFSPISFR